MNFFLIFIIVIVIIIMLSFSIQSFIYNLKNLDKVKDGSIFKKWFCLLERINETLEKYEGKKVMYIIYLSLSIIIYFFPLKFNLDAITGLTGLVAILEGAISDKNDKKIATSNILNISILYIIIVLAGDYISYDPLYRGKEFIKLTEPINFVAILVRAYFLGILYVKSFRTFFFFLKDKNDKKICKN